MSAKSAAVAAPIPLAEPVITTEPPVVYRNPLTGESMKIAASKLPKFKPGKPLKDAIN